MNKRPFIPVWLDDAGFSPSELRVYVHLLRRADNETHVAWPSYDTMTEVCGLGKSTVRRAINELRRRGLIEQMGKPFGGSCRYRVGPIVSRRRQMESGSNGSISSPIECAQIVPSQDYNSSISDPSIVSPERQEGSPKKVTQRRYPKFITDLVDAIWSQTPPKGRERSSKAGLLRELKKAHKSVEGLPSHKEILDGLGAWNDSEKWSDDGGQYVEGIHLWVQRRQWENLPKITKEPKLTTQDLAGGRKLNIRIIPTKNSCKDVQDESPTQWVEDDEPIPF